MKHVQKKWALVFLLSCITVYVRAQQQEETQFDSTVLETKPLVKINKDGGFVKSINMIANARFALNNDFENGKFTSTQFRTNDFRMEIRGKITDKLEFRFRDVVTRSAADGATVDLIRRSVDLAYVGYEITPKLTLVAGKMFAEYGGYEIFYNPITVLLYNEWIGNGDVFLGAVKAGYKLTPKHTLTFQVANSSSRSFIDGYGNTPGAAASKVPLGYTVNWNGNIGNQFSTKWSYTNFTLAKGQHNGIAILGFRYTKKNFNTEYDFKYTNENLDRTGIVSRLIGNDFSNRARDTRYIEHWLRLDYTISPKVSTTAMLMQSNSYWLGNPDNSANKTDRLKTVWTVIPKVEFNLNQQHNAKAFVGYIGRFTSFTGYAKDHFGFQNFNTGQILIGFTSHFIVL